MLTLMMMVMKVYLSSCCSQVHLFKCSFMKHAAGVANNGVYEQLGASGSL